LVLLQVTATYRDSLGQPRCSTLLVPLPLCLFCTVVPPVKNAEYKLTVSTNRDPPQMVDIFQDMLVQVCRRGKGHAKKIESSVA
jgi:Bardet-Biedl syndrome 9 protein